MNNHGQLGLGHTETVKAPTLLVDAATAGAGDDHTDGGSSFGGGNSNDAGAKTMPALILKDMAAYDSASAGVRPDGRVLSWGGGRTGRLGHGVAAVAAPPLPPLPSKTTTATTHGTMAASSSLQQQSQPQPQPQRRQQPLVDVQAEPRLVEGIAGQRVSRVLLGREEIVAFAPTTLVRLEPAAGPVQVGG